MTATPILPTLLSWAVFYPAFFLAVAGLIEALAPASLRDLRGGKGTRASLLLGYSAQCFVGNAYLAVAGLLTWLPNAPYAAATAAAAADKIHADVPYVSTHVLCAIIAHLTADLVLYASLPECRDASLVLHHFATYTLALLSLLDPCYLQYYVIFFAAFCEVSSVFATLYEVFKLLPGLRDLYPRANRAARYALAVSFFFFRLVYWPFFVMTDYVPESLRVLRGEVFTHSKGVVALYLFFNAGFTILQCFWGAKMIRGLRKVKAGL